MVGAEPEREMIRQATCGSKRTGAPNGVSGKDDKLGGRMTNKVMRFFKALQCIHSRQS